MAPNKTAWRRYVAYYRGESACIAITIGFALSRGVAIALFALALRRIIDTTVNGGDPHVLLRSSLIAAGVSIATFVFALGTKYGVVRLTQVVLIKIRRDLFGRLLNLAPDTVPTVGRAQLQSVFVRDTEAVERMTTNLIGGVLPSVIIMAAFAGVLLFLTPVFGALSLCVAVLIWLITRALHTSMARNVAIYATAWAAFNRGVLLTLERLDIVRAAATGELEFAERDAEMSTLYSLGMKTDWSISANTELLALIGNLATVGLLVAGAYYVRNIVKLQDLLTAYLVLLMIRSQMVTIGEAAKDLRIGVVSLTRIWGLLDTPAPEHYCGRRTLSFQGNVQLEGVTFSYDDRVLIDNVSLVLAPRKCVVITGPNGSGKTTLLNLILGVLRPQSGFVSAEGSRYDDIDLSIVRRGIGLIPQEPILFDGTIAENIAYGCPRATQRDIERATRVVGAFEFIQALRDGYETKVGDGGALLSGGQRQRIALARAVLGRPQLLILDEPSNHLDTDAVSQLIVTLGNFEDPPAILIVSHESAILARADTVYEICDGKLSRLPKGTGNIHLLQNQSRLSE